jgi:hypothetical protein
MGRSTVLCLPPKLVLPAIKVSLTLICLLFYPHLFMCEYVCVCLSVGISVSLPLPEPMSFSARVGQIFDNVLRRGSSSI